MPQSILDSTATPSATHPRVIRWCDLPEDHPMAKIDRRRVIGQHLMISQVHLHRGFSLASHRHDNEQIAWVTSGRVRFGLGEAGTPSHRVVTLEAGEVLHLPPGVWHSAAALEDSTVIDIFSPPSEKTGVDG